MAGMPYLASSPPGSSTTYEEVKCRPRYGSWSATTTPRSSGPVITTCLLAIKLGYDALGAVANESKSTRPDGAFADREGGPVARLPVPDDSSHHPTAALERQAGQGRSRAGVAFGVAKASVAFEGVSLNVAYFILPGKFSEIYVATF